VIPHDEIARYEEILRITRLACDMGITKVRLTGGEPFVRKNILSFIQQLCAIKTLKDISITTNGSLLTREKIQALMDMGIRRLNFSAPHIRWYYPPMLLKDSPLLEQPSRGRQRGCWGGSASARQNHHLGLQGGVHHSALKKQNETRPHK
jgi:hypothetical protein